jgi:hypothetical protein
MRFRPANSSSNAMQSSAPRIATELENLTPSRFNSKSSVTDCDHGGVVKSPGITTPAFKKLKPAVAVVNYPQTIDIPSKGLIRAFYDSAVSQQGSHQNQLDEIGCGLLSLEEVLIPAVAREETKALKKVQAKAQRDTPEAVEALMLCRVAIYESVECGIVSARAARLKREAEEQQRQERTRRDREIAKEKRRIEREEELEQRRLSRIQERNEKRERTKLEMKKNLPKNVEMWQEVAFLMTELAKIRKEEKMWMETEQKLDAKMGELSKLQWDVENNDDDAGVPNLDEEVKERVASAVEDIHLSSLRIQRATQLVTTTVDNANLVRSALFDKYTKDHQFHGYAGVNDPKSLIRILSQD